MLITEMVKSDIHLFKKQLALKEIGFEVLNQAE